LTTKKVDTTKFEAPEELSPGVDPIDRPADMVLQEEKDEDAAPVVGACLGDAATVPEPGDMGVDRPPFLGEIVHFHYGRGFDRAAVVTQCDSSEVCDLIILPPNGEALMGRFNIRRGVAENEWQHANEKVSTQEVRP